MSKAPLVAGGLVGLGILGLVVYNKGYGNGHDDGYKKGHQRGFHDGSQQATQEYEQRIKVMRTQHENQMRELQIQIDKLAQEKTSLEQKLKSKDK